MVRNLSGLFAAFMNSLIQWSVIKNHPRGLAILFVLSILPRILSQLIDPKVSRPYYFVIFIVRNISALDLALLENKSRKIIFLPLSARICKQVYSAFFGLEDTVTDKTYFQESRNSFQSRTRLLQEFWERFLSLLKRLNLLHGVINTNWVYKLSYELNYAAIEQGIPHIVYYKESIKSDFGNRHTSTVTFGQTPFLGSHIFFCSRAAREAYLGHRGISKSNSAIVGFARADPLVDTGSYSQSSAPFFLTLFLDKPSAYCHWWPETIVGQVDVSYKVEEFYKWFFKFAERCPDKCFAIKIKSSNRLPYLDELLVASRMSLPGNVRVFTGGNAQELIEMSSAILNFGSTVGLEALALDVPIYEISPLCKHNPCGLFSDFNDAVNHVADVESLEAMLKHSPKKRIPREIQNSTLEHFFGFIDGKNSDRINRAIERVISSESHPKHAEK